MKLKLLAIAFCVASITYAQAPQAKVEQGTLEGITLPSGIKNYRGIPFAQPPVGNLRWKAPQPPKSWSGIRKADAFGNNAMQKPVFGDMSFRAPNMSEDCLYLNVWTPAKKTGEKLPVLVYFYGGGFIAGDGSENRYDGESLAEKGIVTVTLNYRLGIFGFFSHPELTVESPNHASGNYGLLDQNAALLWVRKNIAAFGGDPNKITIAGESAGSISVSAQMASPLSKNLIAGAIGQSGAMINPTLDAIPMADHEKHGIEFAGKVKAGSLAALRAIPAEQLLDEASKWGAFNTKAVVDGYFLPKLPSEIFAAGEQAKVPLLAGWTSAEIPYGAFMQGQFPNPENYVARVKAQYGEQAGEVLKLYPGTTQEEVIKSATALASDNFIVYSTWKWLELHRKTSNTPVYAYIFSRPRPPMVAEMGNAKSGLAGGVIKDDGTKPENALPDNMTGAAHASDIEYLLGNLKSNTVFDWTADDYKASETGEDYFANFIKTGNPNGKGLVQWPESKPKDAEMTIMKLDKTVKSYKEPHRNRYLFLDKKFLKK
ncbi:carboxylesterase [Flavobacterium akiainvivens]|uniref:Carboxylic ester hydrolase n=1 Tax=Flavobacterium akiainvivens TaxID=1202724 RepID=A0A0N0RQE6_9FLAO|nr:carboxylesterase family protein [Flavobacterium akiainvivens]KOS05056.1 carboxylesterase [Flavobacterium akiainvivens]SFQ52115.1 para-nitrobenzyl esterase [Flavobacterium akiainvivens]